VLAAVLDGYDGARLTRGLVRDQRTAVSVGAGYDTGNRGPALFYLHGVPAAGKTTARGRGLALREQVARVAERA
jgi:zinc protease